MSQTATIVPTAAIAERWEATTPVTGDYARDCAELAREALKLASHKLPITTKFIKKETEIGGEEQ